MKSILLLIVHAEVVGEVTRPFEGSYQIELEGRTMILPLLQIVLIVAIGLYLGYLRGRMRRRNNQSWGALLARLRPEWSARELGDHSLWQEALNVTSEDAWLRVDGPRGMWAMYENAQVMMEMAEYAARNSDSVDRLLLETLRSDAMKIRICVFSAMIQYALSKANEGIRINAFRAASTYATMASQLTTFLEASEPGMVPNFVAAM
jgi:hypothetical protein